MSEGIAPAKQQAIAVLTPTLGPIHMLWHISQCNLIFPMNTGSGRVPLIDKKGGQVGQLRNELIVRILDDQKSNTKQHVSHVLWVDDDVLVNRAALLRLLSWDRDVVAGVYFAKTEVAQPLIFDGPCSGFCKYTPVATHESIPIPSEGVEKWGYSQGLSLVRLDVYRRMQEELDIGQDEYGHPAWYKQPPFGVTENGGLSLGGTEDFWFFENLSKLGIRPLVDLTKFCFGWHFDGKTGYPKTQFEQYIKNEPVVWPTPDGKEVIWS